MTIIKVQYIILILILIVAVLALVLVLVSFAGSYIHLCSVGVVRCSHVWPSLPGEGHHSSWGRSQQAQSCCSDAEQLLIFILKLLINLNVIHTGLGDGKSLLPAQALDK